MRVHAFLAGAGDLPRVLAGGASQPPGVALTTRVDPANLASLAEIVSGGELSSGEAAELLRQPALTAGPRGPSIYAVPEEVTQRLGNSSPDERARWILAWTGGAGRITGEGLAQVAQLTAARTKDQALYLWVAEDA